jgi:hypothetical protein
MCTVTNKTASKKDRDLVSTDTPKAVPAPPPPLQPIPLPHLLLDPRLVICQSIERPRLVYHQKALEARHRQLPLGNSERGLGSERVDAVVRERGSVVNDADVGCLARSQSRAVT